ncbi:MAG: hypothetical protein IPL65_14295 [Lewinellaceae bacterium]|nr:hypothetical protein [Lewinellaceae bacterium]
MEKQRFLFNFQMFISELKENPDKKEMIEKYANLFPERVDKELEEQPWYEGYAKQFQTIEYKVPEELKNDFDWPLLLQLLCASFSSDFELIFMEEQKLPELSIYVRQGDQVVVKQVSELWGFQVLRLYEIYTEEQMNLQILFDEDKNERDAIQLQRKTRILKGKKQINEAEATIKINSFLE